MAFVELEDIYGSLELVVFPNVLDKYSSLVIDDSKILVKGKLSFREDEDIKIICDEIHPLKNSVKPIKAELVYTNNKVKLNQKDANIKRFIYINADKIDIERFEAFISYFGGFGNTEFILRKNENGVKFEKHLGPRYAIKDSEEMLKELKDIIGDNNMFIKR